ncbi:MAG TPA: CAP domain-containing protein [Polyangia bacterium]|nr:CAP domain-containing protein [Polyangia bacterium]
MALAAVALAPPAALGGPADGGPLVPARPAAEAYLGEPMTAGGPPRDRLRDAIVADARAAAAQAGLPAPEPDARLDWAMTELARRLRADDLPDPEAISFLLAHYGLVEPAPRILSGEATTGGDEALRGHAREEIVAALRAGGFGRVGVGIERTAGKVYLVAAFQQTSLTLKGAVSRRLPSGGRARIAARIAAAYREPELVITWPDGSVHQVAPTVRGRELAGELRCGADGRYQVEVGAVGAVGPTVLANFPVYCGVAPPRSFRGPAAMRQGPADAAAAEREIVTLVNHDRARAGLPVLDVDPRLTAVARDHCQDMIAHDFVGHVSPRTGTSMDRVHRAGLKPELVLENVGRFYSAAQAESGFLGSPGHRGNLLDPRPRHIGVGVVYGPEVTGTRPMFVTQILTR